MTKKPAEQGNRRAIRLTDEQRLNWLRLIRSENVGPVTFHDLINHFHSAAAGIEALPDLIKRGSSARRLKICSREDVEAEIERAARCMRCQLRRYWRAQLSPLRAVDSPPPIIAVSSASGILVQRSIAIVGSRNASINGMRLAAQFPAYRGNEGFTIVSCLARGIDATAHKHSLLTGTVAVFAGGVDSVFTEENLTLAESILDQGGALVSEMSIG